MIILLILVAIVFLVIVGGAVCNGLGVIGGLIYAIVTQRK